MTKNSPITFLTEEMKTRAVAIADRAMLELLQAHSFQLGIDDFPSFALISETQEEVEKLADADPTIREAFEWLQSRGLATLKRDRQGEYIALTFADCEFTSEVGA